MSTEKTQVVAAVIQRDSLYLLCRRPEGKRHALLWEFPGGKLEAGESFLQAAHRELTEELALSVTAVGDVHLVVADPGSNYVVNFIDVDAAGVPQPLEHEEIRWMTLVEMSTVELAPTDRIFVDFLRSSNIAGNDASVG